VHVVGQVVQIWLWMYRNKEHADKDWQPVNWTDTEAGFQNLHVLAWRVVSSRPVKGVCENLEERWEMAAVAVPPTSQPWCLYSIWHDMWNYLLVWAWLRWCAS
jgi:hypothetical protein